MINAYLKNLEQKGSLPVKKSNQVTGSINVKLIIPNSTTSSNLSQSNKPIESRVATQPTGTATPNDMQDHEEASTLSTLVDGVKSGVCNMLRNLKDNAPSIAFNMAQVFIVSFAEAMINNTIGKGNQSISGTVKDAAIKAGQSGLTQASTIIAEEVKKAILNKVDEKLRPMFSKQFAEDLLRELRNLRLSDFQNLTSTDGVINIIKEKFSSLISNRINTIINNLPQNAKGSEIASKILKETLSIFPEGIRNKLSGELESTVNSLCEKLKNVTSNEFSKILVDALLEKFSDLDKIFGADIENALRDIQQSVQNSTTPQPSSTSGTNENFDEGPGPY